MALGQFALAVHLFLPVSTIPLMLHTPCCSHQKDKRVGPEYLPKSSVFFSEIGAYLVKRNFSLVYEGLQDGTWPSSLESRSPKANAAQSLYVHSKPKTSHQSKSLRSNSRHSLQQHQSSVWPHEDRQPEWDIRQRKHNPRYRFPQQRVARAGNC